MKLVSDRRSLGVLSTTEASLAAVPSTCSGCAATHHDSALSVPGSSRRTPLQGGFGITAIGTPIALKERASA